MMSLLSSYARQPTVSTNSFSPDSRQYSSSQHMALAKAIMHDASASASSSSAPRVRLQDMDFADASDGDENEDDLAAIRITVNSVGSSASSYSSAGSGESTLHAAMSAHHKVKTQAKGRSPSPSCSNSRAGQSRIIMPTSPVQIPYQAQHRGSACQTKPGRTHCRRGVRQHHSPNSISPSMAALLAITDIPRPQRRRRRTEHPLTVDEIVNGYQLSEKDVNLSLGRGPLDLLLSPPGDLMENDLSISDSNIGSILARTASADSMPSLDGESFFTEAGTSIDTPRSSATSTRRRQSPVRKSLEPIRSPPDAAEKHPLAIDDELDAPELTFPLTENAGETFSSFPLLQPFKPLRTAFKSNLTASLKALRLAAKSFSSINFPSIPADDFLTRSLLTIDPNVPYMDERRPPVTKEMPSAQLRRYLNPSTGNPDAQAKTRAAGTFSASIQMQTYKVQRSQSAPPAPSAAAAAPRAPPAGNVSPSESAAHATNPTQSSNKSDSPTSPAPGMRQREVRENSDFIRIAVMEMAMRRRGKLDSQKPGRARWALPPRRPSTKPYEIGSNGVPSRWIAVTH